MENGITILGSTGSIGRQTLEVAESLGLKVRALSANNSTGLLEEQIRKYKPVLVAVYDERAALDLSKRVSDTGVRVVGGPEGQNEAAGHSGADIIVTAIAGMAGLGPTLAAIRTGKRLALANKEPLVCAGEEVVRTARECGTEIIPVDSEHSAIFQCLAEVRLQKDEARLQNLSAPHPATAPPQIKKIILTASGGPFREMSRAELGKVTPEQALLHPNWKMGKKVTIDSATLMNKGLELIEAMHLFGVAPQQVEVVIHPESIIHSMVEFTDGSTIAQLSNPDMRLPIQYALTYPERRPSPVKPLDLLQIKQLTFEKPDLDAFPCLRLAYIAAEQGSEACAALNRANEEAVARFLNKEISFYGISDIIQEALKSIKG